MKLYDIVELTVDRPEDDLTAGMAGTIVDEHPSGQNPPEAYEVEFVDNNGKTIALIVLRPDQIRPVAS
ncbi:DUF4926 domain-containing protein [Prauserella cavernicola]|uniref:DUF4926 domain-containing protein n=1 Tax=Prauserella cavernicola TaxID=2800127 RepID=A0A934QX65_9PSEU|nr:DUF4926 domain-containing protein [Prauserella cavernicola]MBK1788310.1 DUF4926 domain-containing protein [Prauserella cavernicola]